MSKNISCTVPDTQKAETILGALQSKGFSNSQVSVLFPEMDTTKKWVQEKHTKAPEGAVTGVGTGGVIGGVLGWLVGIGSIAIPGVGPFIAAGPILAALGGTAIGAAVGGLTGTLVGLGIPEYEAKEYEKKIKEGKILISVHIENEDKERREQARAIFKEYGASDISEDQEVHVVSETGTTKVA